MFRRQPCTVIDVDFLDQKVVIQNKTDDILHRAFGVLEHPTWNDFENFLRDRCFPQTLSLIHIFRTQLLTVLNATVDIITESQCAFECRIHICPATLKEGDKLLELLPELVILVEDGHEAEQEARTGAVAGTNRIGLQGLCAVLHLCGIEFAGDGVEDHTVRLVGGSILTDAVSSALMPDGAEAIDTLPILRCAHQLGVCEQGPHRRRMERGLLSCTGCCLLSPSRCV